MPDDNLTAKPLKAYPSRIYCLPREVRGIEANVTESFHVVDECSFNNSWCDILDYYRLSTYQL